MLISTSLITTHAPKRIAVAPVFREGLRVNRINQTGETGLISFVADVPFGNPEQF
jgi:hypothetical protein